jgi:hypothetical protein
MRLIRNLQRAIQHPAHLVKLIVAKTIQHPAHLVKLIVAKTIIQSHLLKTIRNLKIVNKNKNFFILKIK